jgi:hypothetical protein
MTLRCTSPERQHDNSITDCCVPVKKLRELQADVKTAEEFCHITNDYVFSIKQKSAYWSKIMSKQCGN